MRRLSKLTDERTSEIIKANPGRFPSNANFKGKKIKRTQLSKIILILPDEQGFFKTEEDIFYFLYKEILIAIVNAKTLQITWCNIERIHNNGLNNSVRYILKELSMYNRIDIVNTGRYRVLKRWDNKCNPRYFYSGAVMQLDINMNDFDLLTEDFKPYGRPSPGEKETIW